MTLKKWVLLGVSVIALIFMISISGKMGEQVNSDEIVVIQDPIDGELHVHVGNTATGGLVWQNFGSVVHYKKSFQYWFSKNNAEGELGDQSIKVRFNDGGHAQLSGSIRIDMPVDDASVTRLHTKYGSQDAIEHALIGQLITKSVYMTGPMMSSKESNSERRTQLLGYIEDQAINGIYKTIVTTAKVKDPMDETQERTVSVVQILMGPDNITPLRQEVSSAKEFNMRLYNLTINSIDYDKDVEAQIKTQQQAIMSVQTAIANAKKAEQDKFTVEQQGMANAAKAKWEQEVLKATAITEAQQQLEVQELATKTSASHKQQLILEGEGEATKKQLGMQANGALEQKLAAWIEVNKAYAAAMSNSNWVPTTIMGGNAGTIGAGYSMGAMNLIDLMTAKTAQDLNLNFKPTK